MGFERERLHDIIRNLDPGWIGRGDEMGLDGKAGLGGGIVDIVKNKVKGTQRTSGPGFADFAKQAVLNRIPRGGARRIVADRDGQA